MREKLSGSKFITDVGSSFGNSYGEVSRNIEVSDLV